MVSKSPKALHPPSSAQLPAPASSGVFTMQRDELADPQIEAAAALAKGLDGSALDERRCPSTGAEADGRGRLPRIVASMLRSALAYEARGLGERIEA